jgi:exosortase C (VPDSG-CTERM-specific)
MNTIKPPGKKTALAPLAAQDARGFEQHQGPRKRLHYCLVFMSLLVLIFIKGLISLAIHAAGSGLHSYILLVPLISAYLIWIEWKQFPGTYISSPGFAIATLAIGLAALAAGWILPLSHNDFLSFMSLSFVSLLATGGFIFLGRKWMRTAAFPISFLIFMVPLPDKVAYSMETALKLSSADAANFFFTISGTPILRDGVVFQLPGITLEVAQECSGINSSIVLFMTSLLASHLFLKSPWSRTLLVAVVIPLAILRNGFRILVIGWLCVEVGPHMIHSPIHKRGGPLFFALSLIPLFVLLWWLRRHEAGRRHAPIRLSDASRASDVLG